MSVSPVGPVVCTVGLHAMFGADHCRQLASEAGTLDWLLYVIPLARAYRMVSGSLDWLFYVIPLARAYRIVIGSIYWLLYVIPLPWV